MAFWSRQSQFNLWTSSYKCPLSTHTHPSARTTHLCLFSMACLNDGFSMMPSSLQLLRRGALVWLGFLQLGTSPHFMGCKTRSAAATRSASPSPPCPHCWSWWRWGEVMKCLTWAWVGERRTGLQKHKSDRPLPNHLNAHFSNPFDPHTSKKKNFLGCNFTHIQ